MAVVRKVGKEALLTPQQSLDFTERKHGGRRPGAGRPRKKESERRFIAHRARPVHRKGDPVHVTLRVAFGIPSLRQQVLERIIKSILRKQRNVLREKNETDFQVVHFTIQSDHLHLIVEAADKGALARRMAGLEIRIARRLNALLLRKGRVWGERYHRHDLRTPTEVRNALRYVLLNAQKHIRVIGDRSFADPFSSAASFDGFAHPFVTFHDETPWARVEPRTWLLGVGWRRHGLIDPGEPPRITH